jgi:hypothetical protein
MTGRVAEFSGVVDLDTVRIPELNQFSAVAARAVWSAVESIETGAVDAVL